MSRADEIIRWVKGPDVLDVGCAGHVPRPGDPLWVHGRIREQFPEAWGIDMSSANIRSLQELGYKNLHVADAQSFSLPIKFDTIVGGEVIEHLQNPGEFLLNVSSHLKPTGRLVLTTPTPFGLFNFLYATVKYPKTCSNPEHVAWFCPSTLQELATRIGLEVQSWRLIEDYNPEGPTSAYRTFYRMMTLMGHLLPARLRCNAMLFVLSKRSQD